MWCKIYSPYSVLFASLLLMYQSFIYIFIWIHFRFKIQRSLISLFFRPFLYSKSFHSLSWLCKCHADNQKNTLRTFLLKTTSNSKIKGTMWVISFVQSLNLEVWTWMVPLSPLYQSVYWKSSTVHFQKLYKEKKKRQGSVTSLDLPPKTSVHTISTLANPLNQLGKITVQNSDV